MTVLVAERIERRASLFGPDRTAPEESEPAAVRVRRPTHDLGGGRLTLDEAIVGAWEGLAAQISVVCPLCEGALAPRSADGDVAGRCTDCGTRLS